MNVRTGIGLGVFLLAIAIAFFAPDTYTLFLLGMVAATTIVGVGLNILVGLSGQLSIGHAGFFAIGAYTSVLLTTKADWGFWPGLLAAAIATAITGAVLAAPALRVSGAYLAMVTISFGIIVERVAIEWAGLTGGFGGISDIPKPTFLGLEPALRDAVFLAVSLAALSIVIFALLKQHPWGKAFQAVRDDEIAATTIGLNVLQIRIVAFALSAAFTGLGGVFFAVVLGFVSPDSFTSDRSILFLLVVLLGGVGTAEGALLGAIALVILPEFFQDFADYQLLFFGLLLLLTLWLAPEGVAHYLLRWLAPQKPLYPPDIPPETLPLQFGKNSQPLQVEGVSIHFGGVRAVDDVHFTAHPGLVTAAIGPNGAGKTTLLNLIGGFYKPQTGRIYLGHLEITRRSTVDISRLGIARTFQATRLFDSLSVLDNLRIAATQGRLGNVLGALLGFGKSNTLDRYLLKLLVYVGYRGNVHTRGKDLSFVDRRLVEIARALATRPQTLLLDEPAAGLSREDKNALARLIRQIANAGLNVILVEHDMALVMPLSDTAIVMDGGRKIAEGSPARVQADPQVLEAYLGVSDATLPTPPPPQLQAESPLLEVDRLSSGYGQLKVLEGISLYVNQGELVAVIGANGAGKSTLLKTICGAIAPWQGDVRLQGLSVTKIPSHRLVSRGLVLVPEGRQVFSELSVGDNLRLGAFHRSDMASATRRKRLIEANIQALLERFPPLQGLLDRRAGLLSGGEQQMLAIARGLMAKPKVLLLDEPSLGLAPQLVASLYATLAELRDDGVTILLVDQMAKLALEVANRAYLLDSGRIVRSGSPQELQQEKAIAQAYLGVPDY